MSARVHIAMTSLLSTACSPLPCPAPAPAPAPLCGRRCLLGIHFANILMNLCNRFFLFLLFLSVCLSCTYFICFLLLPALWLLSVCGYVPLVPLLLPPFLAAAVICLLRVTPLARRDAELSSFPSGRLSTLFICRRTQQKKVSVNVCVCVIYTHTCICIVCAYLGKDFNCYFYTPRKFSERVIPTKRNILNIKKRFLSIW